MESLKVLYEDNHIIVVEKKPNIPSQADKTGDIDMLTIVKNYIKNKYNKPGNVYLGLVHRLDRPVGGVMVFAKTSKAASRLSEEVRNKTFKKTYLAVVDGEFENKDGTLEDYLYKDERNNMSKVVNATKKNAKLAKLDYKVLGYSILFLLGLIVMFIMFVRATRKDEKEEIKDYQKNKQLKLMLNEIKPTKIEKKKKNTKKEEKNITVKEIIEDVKVEEIKEKPKKNNKTKIKENDQTIEIEIL